MRRIRASRSNSRPIPSVGFTWRWSGGWLRAKWAVWNWPLDATPKTGRNSRPGQPRRAKRSRSSRSWSGSGRREQEMKQHWWKCSPRRAARIRSGSIWPRSAIPCSAMSPTEAAGSACSTTWPSRDRCCTPGRSGSPIQRPASPSNTQSRPRWTWNACWSGSGGQVSGLTEGGSRLLVGLGDGELRELLGDVLGRAEKDAGIGGLEHAGVVVGVAGRDHVEVESFEGQHRGQFLIGQAQVIVDDPPVRRDRQSVAEERGVVELLHHGRGELLEGVGEDDHLAARTQPRQEVLRAVQRRHRGDHALDVLQREPVFFQDLQPPLHQHVIVWLVPRRQAQLGDLRLRGDVDPDLGRQNSFHVETRDDGFDLQGGCPQAIPFVRVSANSRPLIWFLSGWAEVRS